MEKKKNQKKYFLKYVVFFLMLFLIILPVRALDSLFNKVVDAGEGFKNVAGKLESQWRDVEIKSVFYKYGFVTADFEHFNNADRFRENKFKLVYYDGNGKVKESKTIDYMPDYPNHSYIWFGDIIALDDYFYVVSSTSKVIDGTWKNVLVITKYDSKLDEKVSKDIVPEREIVNISSIDMLFSIYDNEIYVYFGEDNKQIITVDKDLSDVKTIEVNDVNLEKYFLGKYVEKQNLQDDLKFSSSDVSGSKQVIVGSTYNDEEDKYKAYLYIKNGEKEVKKIDDNYTNFYSSVIMGDYILVLARTNILIHTSNEEISSYDEREMYKSEILVYDLEGNIIDKKGQQENATFFNINVVNQKILISRLYSDGICDYVERTTSGFTTPEKRYENCDSRFSNYVYEIKEIEPEPEIKNPETGAFIAITTTFVAILFASIVVLNNKNKILKI